MLSLGLARTALIGAESEAQRLGVSISIAIVDTAGAPLVLLRMDGAIPATAELAIGKAFAAAYWQRPSGDLEALAKDRPAYFAALQATARRPLVPAAGGLTIEQGRAVIGGIGVAGARSGEEDVICAQAGLLAAGLSPL